MGLVRAGGLVYLPSRGRMKEQVGRLELKFLKELKWLDRLDAWFSPNSCSLFYSSEINPFPVLKNWSCRPAAALRDSHMLAKVQSGFVCGGSGGPTAFIVKFLPAFQCETIKMKILTLGVPALEDSHCHYNRGRCIVKRPVL